MCKGAKIHKKNSIRIKSVAGWNRSENESTPQTEKKTDAVLMDLYIVSST